MKTSALYLVSVVIIVAVSLGLLKLADLLLGPYVASRIELFPPGQQVIYRTSEFDALATINRFGFRGGETELKNGQIITVGDSTTFGFGAHDDETWPRQLQMMLAQTGMSLDVYNLGVPGTDTLFHIETARAYVERLKPKYVILSVLLSDDFQQVHEAKFSGRLDRSRVLSALKALYPHLYRFYKCELSWLGTKEAQKQVPVVTASWKHDAAPYLADRTASYPEDVRVRIQAGDVNPGLLYLAKKYPDRAWSFWSAAAESGSSEAAVCRMMEQKLAQLNKVVTAQGGRLIVFSMPSGAFVRSTTSENYKKYGFSAIDQSLADTTAEWRLQELSHRAGAGFVPSLSAFRGYDSTTTELFFPYDGHLTKRGNLLAAELVFTELKHLVAAGEAPRAFRR
jgi:hypothetical protein